MVARLRSAGRRVAVLAVDPSSPFSGGALLGDRVRMGEHATDPGVYIRSMSSRGELGGLSAAAPAAADLFSAIGFDDVLVETVGVGQNEIAVMRLADSVVVVLAPGMGDGIQAAKAGILEIADILVVNKSDHDGASGTVRDLKGMLALGRTTGARPPSRTAGGSRCFPRSLRRRTESMSCSTRLPPIGSTLTSVGGRAARRRLRAEVAVQAVVLERVLAALTSEPGLERLAAAAGPVADGRTDHHRAAQQVLEWLGPRSSS